MGAILPLSHDHNSSSTALVDLDSSSYTNGNYRTSGDGLGISSPSGEGGLDLGETTREETVIVIDDNRTSVKGEGKGKGKGSPQSDSPHDLA